MSQEEFKRLVRARDLRQFQERLKTHTLNHDYAILCQAASVDASQKFIDYLIDECGIDPNFTDSYGWSAVFYAVCHGFDGNLRELIMKGANIRLVSNNGYNCMHVVAEYFTRRCADILFVFEFDITQGPHGDTPVHVAVRKNSLAALKYFYRKKPEAFMKALSVEDGEGKTPIQHAEDPDIIEFFKDLNEMTTAKEKLERWWLY